MAGFAGADTRRRRSLRRGAPIGRRARSCQGLSLVEALVTTSLLGLLFAGTMASTEWTMPSWRVRAATTALATELRWARHRAMTQRIAVTVDFDAVAEQYATVDGEGGNTIRITDLPIGVSFTHPSGGDTVTLEPPGTSDTAALFNPRGQLLSTTTPGHVYFGNEPRGIYMRIAVNVVGAVTVESWNGSVWK